MTELSVDELSELEAYLCLCCEEAVRDGWTITPRYTIYRKERLCCPVGAAALSVGWPHESVYHIGLHVLGVLNATDLAHGFDRTDWLPSSPFFAMGRRMRERLEAGEFNQC